MTRPASTFDLLLDTWRWHAVIWHGMDAEQARTEIQTLLDLDLIRVREEGPWTLLVADGIVRFRVDTEKLTLAMYEFDPVLTVLSSRTTVE